MKMMMMTVMTMHSLYGIPPNEALKEVNKNQIIIMVLVHICECYVPDAHKAFNIALILTIS